MQMTHPKVNCIHFLVHVKNKLREMSPVETGPISLAWLKSIFCQVRLLLELLNAILQGTTLPSWFQKSTPHQSLRAHSLRQVMIQ